jgi:hypothetical protein
MVAVLFGFLIGAWVSKMHYSSKTKSIIAERDAWEKKAKQAHADMYKDIMKNASSEMDNI